MHRVAVTRTVWYGRMATLSLVAVLTLGYTSARLALHLVSLVDPTRLVPVSGWDILLAAPLILVLYIIGVTLALRFPVPQPVMWYSLFFSLRVVTAVILALIFQYDDERAFHNAGLAQPYGIFFFEAGRGYYHLVNILYSLLGPNILLPKMVNAFLGSLLPFFAFDVARWLFGDSKAGWRAFVFTGILPPFVTFSAVNLKEIPTAFLLLVLVWALTNPKSGYLRRLAVCIACTLTLYWLRGAALATIGVIGIIGYYMWGMRLRFSPLVKIASVVVLAGLFISPLLGQIQQMVWSRTTREEYFIKRFAESEATVTKFLDIGKPLSWRNLALLFLRGLYSPVPFRFLLDHGIDTLLEALNTVVWYILLPMAVVGLLAFRRSSAVITCALMVLGVLIIATIGVVVGSDPYRHKIMGMSLVAILAAGGLTKDIVHRFRWVIGLWIMGRWVSAFCG